MKTIDETLAFFDYDKALQDVESKIVKAETLTELLELYSRQSVILKAMLEQSELETLHYFKKATKVK